MLVRPAASGSPFATVIDTLKGTTDRVLLDLTDASALDGEPAATLEEAIAWGVAQARLAELPGVTVALITGQVRGPLSGLAVACKRRKAATDATIAITEAAEGLLPAGETMWRLLDLCELGDALALIIRGSKLDAPGALKLNLLDAVGPQDSLVDLGAGLRVRDRKRPKSFLRWGLSRFLLKRKAVAELRHLASPHASMTACRLLFDLARARSLERINTVAQEIEALARDPERDRLARLASARRAFLTDGKAVPKRALLLLGEMGWRWAYVLAHFGVRVRWCSPDDKALAEGLCWLRRDAERYFPDRVNAILRHVTVSERTYGFAGRDFVVVDDPAALDSQARSLLPADAVVIVDRTGNQGIESHPIDPAPGPFPTVVFPYDALTSRVCRCDPADDTVRALLRGLGYLVLPKEEGQIVFAAVHSFQRCWADKRNAGHGSATLLASLQRYGFAVRELRRRTGVAGRLKRGDEGIARELIGALMDSVRAGRGSPDLINLALVLELGFPIHRGTPADRPSFSH